MQKNLHSKTFMIYFLTFTGKIAKPCFAISLEEKKKETCLPALKIVPMLGETNNQFYMAFASTYLRTTFCVCLGQTKMIVGFP